MNAYSIANQNLNSSRLVIPAFVPATAPSRPPRRERDFGVGYGTSSGYASPRRYVTGNGLRLFRCA